MEENQLNQQLSKQERYELKHRQKLDEQARVARKNTIKKILKIAIILLLTGSLAWLIIWYIANRPTTLESEIIARNGIHWHPEIKISILGENQEIPANVGFGIVERPIHTHDDMGVIHLEFSGLVKKNDVQLGQFFKIWGKKFNKDCIFDKCSGEEGKLKMLVNGKENSEFENYLMQDGDKIEIIYE